MKTICTVMTTTSLILLMGMLTHWAYTLCMTEDQWNPIMGWAGTFLPAVAVILSFGLGFTFANVLRGVK